MVPSDFASLDHEVLELFVDLSGRVLPREQVAYRTAGSARLSKN